MPEPKILLELYLVRHGESMSQTGESDSMEDEYKYDPPLSAKGLREAELLGEYLSDQPFDHILCSGMRRALRTAYEIAVRQPENGARTAEVHKIFTECGTSSDTRGRSVREIQKELPCMLPAEGTDMDEVQIVYSDRADDDALLMRGKAAMDYLLSRFHNGEKVLVAAHAAFDTFMFWAALGLDCPQKFDPSFFNTSLTKIVFFAEGTGAYADIHLEYHNAVPHLVREFPQFRY